jgi:hypothetical protein
MPFVEPELTWDSLKARARGLRQHTDETSRNWQIRVHRALSWLKHASDLPDSQPEARFLLLWIALNSLYAAWDSKGNRPLRDSLARHRFVERLVRLDEKKIAGLLRSQRPVVRGLLSDPCLTAEFWRNPHDPQTEAVAIADSKTFDADLRAGNNEAILKSLMERLFILRGQIVHGASSAGSALNRSAVRGSLSFLERLVPVIIYIVLERGKDSDWPELCYPPLT